MRNGSNCISAYKQALIVGAFVSEEDDDGLENLNWFLSDLSV